MEQVTPEQLAYIVGAAVLVVLAQSLWAWRGPIIDWARDVLSSIPALPRRDYVTMNAAESNVIRVSADGKAESENQAEAENVGKSLGITPAQLTELREVTREEATARALGALLGAGLIVPDGRTRAMSLLFGAPGRRHSRVRPWVEQAEAAARLNAPAPVEEEPRLIPVHDGRSGFVER